MNQEDQKSRPTTFKFSGILSGVIEVGGESKLTVTDNYGREYNVRIDLKQQRDDQEEFFAICYMNGKQVECSQKA